MASQPELEIRPIAGCLGAEVRGLDADTLDQAMADALKRALVEHLVLFLPGLDTAERRLLRRVTVLGDDPQAPAGVQAWPRHKSDKSASSGFYGIGGYEF